MKPNPEETRIVGGWVFKGPRGLGDSLSDRINYIIHRHLVLIDKNIKDWVFIYQDPEDKRYWRYTCPPFTDKDGVCCILEVIEWPEKK